MKEISKSKQLSVQHFNDNTHVEKKKLQEKTDLVDILENTLQNIISEMERIRGELENAYAQLNSQSPSTEFS